MRLIFTALTIFLIFVAPFAHADTKSVNQIEYVPTVQYWQLEWLKGFEPSKPIYKGKPFDWSLTRLATDIEDARNWSYFGAGCNGVSRSQSITAPKSGTALGPKWHVSITQVGCTELVEDGEESREVISRYADVEVKLLGSAIGDDHAPNIVLSGEHMTWLDRDGTALVKFRKIHALADGHSWEVDRAFHKDSDAYYDRNFSPEIRFFDTKISLYQSCENVNFDVVINENQIKFSGDTRPKICREPIFKHDQLVEAPSETEQNQPLQRVYDGISKAVRFKRYTAEGYGGNRYSAELGIRRQYMIKLFDKDDNVVLQLIPVANGSTSKQRKHLYKGQWQLTGPENKANGPILDLSEQNSVFANSCDDGMWSNVWSARENEIRFSIGQRDLDHTPTPCDVSDLKYSQYQARLERIVKQTSRYVVDEAHLYLANDDLDILGRFVRVSTPIND